MDLFIAHKAFTKSSVPVIIDVSDFMMEEIVTGNG